MNDVWKRIRAELERRNESRDRPVAWLADKLGMQIQRVNNWASRGVPASAFAPIALALGWSIDDVAGTSTPDGRPPWPFTMVDRDRWDALTERQRGFVEAKINEALNACAPGKPLTPLEKSSVQMGAPDVRIAHSTPAPGRQTSAPVWDEGMEGEKDGISRKARGVASSADGRRTARPAGKGRTG